MSGNLFTPPKHVQLTLVGLNDNAYALMGAFDRAARRAKWPQADIDKVLAEAKSGNYDNLVATLAAHCEDPTG